MVETQPEPSFGRYLRAVREQKGMPIQEVSDLTKIPVHILRDLEGEVLQRLPEAVYVKGFIRSYAEAVGADPVEAARLYQEKTPTSIRPDKFDTKRQGVRKRFWPGFFLSLCGLAGIILISVLGTSVIKGSKPSIRQPKPDAGVSSPHAAGRRAEVPGEESSSDPVEAAESMPSEGWLLDMKAVFDTWVRVTIDDHGPKEYLLKTGDQLALKATSTFLLHIGDPTGVVVNLNGKPFLIEGKKGQPVKLKLP